MTEAARVAWKLALRGSGVTVGKLEYSEIGSAVLLILRLLTRCPHCGDRTITFVAKVAAISGKPISCPHCGQKGMLRLWVSHALLVLPYIAGAALFVWFIYTYKVTSWMMVGVFWLYLVLAAAIGLTVVGLFVPVIPYSSTSVSRFNRTLLVLIGVVVFCLLVTKLF
jgi:DNA-directed RNA polymerase subunit RPC12/RpoP